MTKNKEVDWSLFPVQKMAREKLAILRNVSIDSISFADANWSALNDSLTTAMEAANHADYRTTKVEMVRQLCNEGRLLEAKRHVPECIYIFFAQALTDKFYIDLGIDPPAFFPHPEIALFKQIDSQWTKIKVEFFESQKLNYWISTYGVDPTAIWQRFELDIAGYENSLKERQMRNQK